MTNRVQAPNLAGRCCSMSVIILEGLPQNLSPAGVGRGIFVMGNQFMVVYLSITVVFTSDFSMQCCEVRWEIGYLGTSLGNWVLRNIVPNFSANEVLNFEVQIFQTNLYFQVETIMTELWKVLGKPHTANFELSIFRDNSVQDKVKCNMSF